MYLILERRCFHGTWFGFGEKLVSFKSAFLVYTPVLMLLNWWHKNEFGTNNVAYK